MMLENVEEFKTWGPLLDEELRPDPERAGETFEAFVGMLSTGIAANHPALAEVCEFLAIEPHGQHAQQLIAGLGYEVDYRELRACDYGAPTIRKRFFMVMRCDGRKIHWPEATHGDQNHWKYKAASWRHGVPRRSALTGISRPGPSSTAKAAGGKYAQTYRARHPALCYRKRIAFHREV